MGEPKHHRAGRGLLEMIGDDLHGRASFSRTRWHLNDESRTWNFQCLVGINVDLRLVIDEVLQRFRDDGAVLRRERLDVDVGG